MCSTGWTLHRKNWEEHTPECISWSVSSFSSRKGRWGRRKTQKGNNGCARRRSYWIKRQYLLQGSQSFCGIKNSQGLRIDFWRNHHDQNFRGRCNCDRQIELRWICNGQLQWKLCIWTCAECSQSRICSGRIFRRICRRCAGRTMPGLIWIGHRRVNSSAGLFLWNRWSKTDIRQGV